MKYKIGSFSLKMLSALVIMKSPHLVVTKMVKRCQLFTVSGLNVRAEIKQNRTKYFYNRTLSAIVRVLLNITSIMVYSVYEIISMAQLLRSLYFFSRLLWGFGKLKYALVEYIQPTVSKGV